MSKNADWLELLRETVATMRTRGRIVKRCGRSGVRFWTAHRLTTVHVRSVTAYAIVGGYLGGSMEP